MTDQPSWLRPLQTSFSMLIKTPLISTKGVLQVDSDGAREASFWFLLDPHAKAAKNGAFQYNRQFWFRIFSILHQELPLTCDVMGHWNFNQLALRAFSREHNDALHLPKSANGISSFFIQCLHQKRENGRTLVSDLSPVVIESLEFDACYLRIFGATDAVMTSEASVSNLLETDESTESCQLIAKGNWGIVRESWNLSDRFSRIKEPAQFRSDNLDNQTLKVLPEQRFLIMAANATSVQWVQIEGARAIFYEMLTRLPVGAAIDALLAQYAGPDVEQKAATWLTESFEMGLWRQTLG